MARAPGNQRSYGARTALAAVALCIALTGCAAGNAVVGGADVTAAFTPIALPSFGHAAPGKPSEVYVKIARLAKACWFAPPAPLQQGYVFTADVNPDSRGGAASIVIFEHNIGESHGTNAERGLKAFEISLSPNGDETSIGAENDRIPEAFAERMKSDIDRWAAGETSCGSSAPWTTTAALGEDAPAGKAGTARLWKASTH